MIWTGIVVSAVGVLFCLFDGVSKLVKPKAVVDATVGLGYEESAIQPIGVTLLVCTLIYAFPKSSVLGAILLTGYLGGAVASNVRVSAPAFNVAFPAFFCVILWAGLALRDPKVATLILSR